MGTVERRGKRTSGGRAVVMALAVVVVAGCKLIAGYELAPTFEDGGADLQARDAADDGAATAPDGRAGDAAADGRDDDAPWRELSVDDDSGQGDLPSADATLESGADAAPPACGELPDWSCRQRTYTCYVECQGTHHYVIDCSDAGCFCRVDHGLAQFCDYALVTGCNTCFEMWNSGCCGI